MPVKVAQYGLGSLGIEIVEALHAKKELKLVGAVDTDPNKIGEDVGIIASDKKIGVKVGSMDEALKKKPDIVLHATTSYLDDAYEQISTIVKNGISVISTCEQLVYPYTSITNIKLAKKLDALAKKHDVTVLGVGVNPGFVMDALVLALTGLCRKIERVRVERVVDVAKRRKALQEKMCLGLTPQEFEKVKKKVGHVGLLESAKMICNALKVKVAFTSNIRPVVANRAFASSELVIEQGQIAGLEHRLVGKSRNQKFIEMILYMFAGASEFDLIEIEGTPPISIRTNGIQGDQATISLLLNYIPIVMSAKSGLLTVKDLPLPHLD
ncbi:MAG: NAD(P)H-dependent amine dehydrogenase family protein [Nitrososphaerales archaeon]